MSAGIPDAQLAEFKEVFSMFDADGDGTIDAAELENILRDLGTPATRTEILELLAVVDTDSNGVIDFEEFCVMMLERNKSGKAPSSQMQEEEIKSVFRALDKDNDGLISAADLQIVIESVNWGHERPPTDSDIKTMLAVGGNTINYAAFCELVGRFQAAPC